MLLILILSLVTYSAQAQFNWWNQTHNWDGATPWTQYMTYSHAFLGPNALPIPTVAGAHKSYASSSAQISLRGDDQFINWHNEVQLVIPKILDKNTLQISLDNNIQLGYFNEEQKELVPYLRKKLDNFALRFETILVESEQVKKLYLPEEKYKHMAEKNANLIYLRQKIKTDLE